VGHMGSHGVRIRKFFNVHVPMYMCACGDPMQLSQLMRHVPTAVPVPAVGLLFVLFLLHE